MELWLWDEFVGPHLGLKNLFVPTPCLLWSCLRYFASALYYTLLSYIFLGSHTLKCLPRDCFARKYVFSS